MCAALVKQAKRAVQSKSVWGGTFLAGLLFAAMTWADSEHKEIERDCQARIDIECEKIDDIYARQTDVEVLKAIMERVETKLDKLTDKVDKVEDW